MVDLQTSDIRHFEHMLGDSRERLRRTLHVALAASLRQDYAKIAGEVHDSGDESVTELLTGLELSGRERELEEMRDVERALERIRQGHFGICLDCGERIERDRLEVFPTAKRCLACQQRRERGRRGGKDATPSL